MKDNPMDTGLLHQFDKELAAEYRGEMYRVRDNGSACRLRRPNNRKRRLDEIWTFGTPSAFTGYMNIGAEVVHRIVATAFHGQQPSEKHIVDHIDTNRRNNRAENLRWITRLDNLLQNPITLRRIINAYGSLDNFFKNPGAPLNPEAIKNFDWMRTVSKEEARESHEKLLRWAASDQAPKGGVLGEWIYGARRDEPVADETSDIQSPTPNAIQRNWRTPSEFLKCPDKVCLTEYAAQLKFGTAFVRNRYGQSLVVIAAMGDGLLIVVCKSPENSMKEWSVAKVTIENEKFVHEGGGTFFTLQGALKQHCSLLAIHFGEWGMSIDDYAS
jgi:HNH endonuclease